MLMKLPRLEADIFEYFENQQGLNMEVLESHLRLVSYGSRSTVTKAFPAPVTEFNLE